MREGNGFAPSLERENGRRSGFWGIMIAAVVMVPLSNLLHLS